MTQDEVRPLADEALEPVEKGFDQAALLSVGGIVAALGAATCCVVPFVLFFAGISGAWIGNLTAFEPYQPVFVTIALARFMIGSQSGSVMSATSTSPGAKSCIWSIEESTRTAPAPSTCERHRNRGPAVSVEEHNITRRAAKPIPCRRTFIVDNVLVGGNTIRACFNALGFGTGLVFGDASFHPYE